MPDFFNVPPEVLQRLILASGDVVPADPPPVPPPVAVAAFPGADPARMDPNVLSAAKAVFFWTMFLEYSAIVHRNYTPQPVVSAFVANAIARCSSEWGVSPLAVIASISDPRLSWQDPGFQREWVTALKNARTVFSGRNVPSLATLKRDLDRWMEKYPQP